jgi:O-antigen ligase
MPVQQRVIGFCAVPFAIVAVFMTAHGLIGTLTSFFAAGTSDQSIATRVDDYPLVERLVSEAPWFGRGGGTYMPDNMLDILDNEFLKTAIELGLVGVFALIAFFLVPLLAALIARRHSDDPDLRLLCAALAGAALTAMVCSLTYDSLSYPMFVNVHALVIGLIGAAWRIAARAEARAPALNGAITIETGQLARPLGV